MNTDEQGLNTLSEKVLGAVFEGSNTLGAGFLEKVYERALLITGHAKEAPSENILPIFLSKAF